MFTAPLKLMYSVALPSAANVAVNFGLFPDRTLVRGIWIHGWLDAVPEPHLYMPAAFGVYHEPIAESGLSTTAVPISRFHAGFINLPLTSIFPTKTATTGIETLPQSGLYVPINYLFLKRSSNPLAFLFGFFVTSGNGGDLGATFLLDAVRVSAKEVAAGGF